MDNIQLRIGISDDGMVVVEMEEAVASKVKGLVLTSQDACKVGLDIIKAAIRCEMSLNNLNFTHEVGSPTCPCGKTATPGNILCADCSERAKDNIN